MFSLVNKHEEFFDFLITASENFHKGCQMVKDVLHYPAKLDRSIKDVSTLKHETNHITHDITVKMRHVFITPIDREDFYLLSSKVNDCVDNIQDVVLSLRLYHAGVATKPPLQMADILIQMSAEMIVLFRLLKDIDKNEAEITVRTRKLNALESDGDSVYRQAISDLFDGTHDVMESIRWKEILETMEDTCNSAEEVGNLIKEVVMKYA